MRVGEIHFVRDGHHRVSVARALGRTDIDAYVTAVVTRISADRAIELSDLPLKSHERVFFERVPLPQAAKGEISLPNPWDYAELAQGVEAWGFRAMQDREEMLGRAETARAWLDEEYRPVVSMLREADLIGDGTATEAYMRIAADRTGSCAHIAGATTSSTEWSRARAAADADHRPETSNLNVAISRPSVQIACAPDDATPGSPAARG
jgi:hypothetical protein